MLEFPVSTRRYLDVDSTLFESDGRQKNLVCLPDCYQCCNLICIIIWVFWLFSKTYAEDLYRYLVVCKNPKIELNSDWLFFRGMRRPSLKVQILKSQIAVLNDIAYFYYDEFLWRIEFFHSTYIVKRDKRLFIFSTINQKEPYYLFYYSFLFWILNIYK